MCLQDWPHLGFFFFCAWVKGPCISPFQELLPSDTNILITWISLSYRGAKTAMTLALKSPELVKDLIPVDNAPIDAALIGRFGTYIQGMKRIEEAGITKQSDADKILQEYEKVSPQRSDA